jgi:peroxiredoxin Q/BCP
MAQLRQDYEQFVQREAEIVVIGPEDRQAFADYWQKEKLPYIGLPDPAHTVANRYGQEVKLLKFGRMPALVVVDKEGYVRFRHYGESMQDIVPNQTLLALLGSASARGRRKPMKTAMIWGANGGIGQALVRRLRGDGWTVVAVARQADRSHHPGDEVLEADLSNPSQVQQAVMAAAQAVDAVDLWVYAAGDITSATVREMTPAIWRQILDANLTGAFLATHYSLPLLAPDAHLFFLGAISERLRLPGWPQTW